MSKQYQLGLEGNATNRDLRDNFSTATHCLRNTASVLGLRCKDILDWHVQESSLYVKHYIGVTVSIVEWADRV